MLDLLPIATIVVGGIGVAALLWAFLGAPASARQRLERAVAVEGTAMPRSAEGVVPALKHDWRRADLAPTITELLERMGLYDRLQIYLLRAGLLLRPSEFAAIALAAAGVGFLVGFVTSGHWTIGALTAAAGFLVPWVYVARRREKRVRRLVAQLPNALDILSSSLRAGYALPRSLQAVASQSHPPLSEEFQRVVYEIRLGVPVQQALNALSLRAGCYDFELMVVAMQIQLSVGGNMAEVLDRLAAMIRERQKLAGEIAALTAEGRMSASILVGLPVLIAFIINAMSPGYLAPLFHTPAGLAMLGGAVFLMGIGVLWIRRMIALEL